MSWFSRESPIVHSPADTVILALEAAGEPGSRSLTRLLFTGCDASNGIVRASAPATGTLWSATLPDRYDVREGRVAIVGDVVVTYDRASGALVGREKWTGKPKWTTPLGRLVGRLGIDAERGEIVAITFDHTVHGVAAATGAKQSRGQAMTDEAATKTLAATRHPAEWNFERGVESRSWIPTWNHHYERATDIQVLQRSWDGELSFAVGFMDQEGAHGLVDVGTGRYNGTALLDTFAIASFELKDGEKGGEDDETCEHWFIFARQPIELLAKLRAKRPSELFHHGHQVWKGRL